MGLQYRNGKCYYTRSRRVNGKVEREYVGSDVLALCAYEWDQLERQAESLQKRQEQEQWQQERVDAVSLDEAVAGVCEGAEVMFRSAMKAAGYHQHTRGEWRKKRQEKTDGN